jgi:Zn-dependent protease with chaperone function
MTFEIRLAIITLAVFAVASTAVSLFVVWLAGSASSSSPGDRASRLLRLRLWPAVAATAAMTLAAAAFLMFEQREYLESTGVLLPCLAMGGLGLWAAGAWRATRLTAETARLRRRWMASAVPVSVPGADVPAFAIDSTFPVVAVIGLFRPRLVVARSVLSVCSQDELRAIAAHENRHVRSQDNLRRAAMVAAPDVLACLPIARRLRAAWSEATEEAADDAADRVGAEGRVWLAEALVRVARLGLPAAADRALPASSLYRGENLDRRVRRLLEPAPQGLRPAAPAWRRLGPFVVVSVACGFALDAVHVVLEIAIRFLP